MTEVHPLCCDCSECLPGFPAKALPVRQDDEVYLPRLPRMVTRQHALDRHTRYRARKRLARELAKP